MVLSFRLPKKYKNVLVKNNWKLENNHLHISIASLFNHLHNITTNRKSFVVPEVLAQMVEYVEIVRPNVVIRV
jgi:hypothetical protein